MSDYQRVKEALDRGVDPELLCSTCPWDRLCINPPTFSRSEVEEKTRPPDEDVDIRSKDFMKSLMNVVIFAGKDTDAKICPVLAVTLSTSDGRIVNESIRVFMTNKVPRNA